MNFSFFSKHLNARYYLFYILSAFIAIWYWHVDEHYQISEFASYKLGFTPLENLAWEFHSQIRSGILPFMMYSLSWIFLKLNIFHPFLIESICRVFAAILFMFSYSKLIEFFESEINDESQRNLFRKFSLFFWILPIVMVRFSSESISASLFWLGFYYYDYRKDKLKISTLILVGFIWGISFYIRMHLAILIGVVFIWSWIILQKRKLDFLYIFFGFLIASIIEIVVNYWLYGTIVWSPYGYFKVNVIDGVSNQFGTMPFYFYIVEIFKNCLPPFSIFILLGLSIYIFKFKKSIFSSIFIFFILIHSLISHKEYRFLFPIFPLLLPLAFIGYQSIEGFKWKHGIVQFLWILNLIILPSCFLIQSFNPYNYFRLYPLTKKYSKLYSDKPCPYALGDKFYTVRPYFWKSPNCTIIELDSLNVSDHISIFMTKKDYGDTIRFNNSTLHKTFQTIPEAINSKLPTSVKSTIDYVYIYQ
jgi:hypothetical protein